MACGIPVVASSHPSMDEACGDAAVRVDPDDAEAMTLGIREALERREELAARRRRARGAVHVAALRRDPSAGVRGGGRVRVGLDVAPLLQTRAGTARWVAGLRRGLEAHADVDVVPLTWGGRGRLTAVARDLRLVPVAAAARAARAGATSSTARSSAAPTRSRVPTIVTVHDLAVLRYPEVFPAWTRLYGRTALRPTIRARGRASLPSRSSPSARWSSSRTSIRTVIDVVPNALEPVFRAGRSGGRGRLRARSRDARAAQEPRPGRRGHARWRASSCGSSARPGGARPACAATT